MVGGKTQQCSLVSRTQNYKVNFLLRQNISFLALLIYSWGIGYGEFVTLSNCFCFSERRKTNFNPSSLSIWFTLNTSEIA